MKSNLRSRAKTELTFYAMFGSLAGEESKGEESNGEKSKGEWFFSILFGCFKKAEIGYMSLKQSVTSFVTTSAN